MISWAKGYSKKIFLCVTIIALVLFMSIGYANSSQENAKKKEVWSIEKTDPLDNIDCAKMIKMGIEKQMNQRASRIRIHCGLEHPQPQSTFSESPLPGSLFTPWAIGGIDVNITGTTDTYSWDSIAWGNGNTIFVAYNTSPSATCAGGSYGHGSYSTDGGATFTRLCPNPFATGHTQNYGDPMGVYNAKLAKWYVVFLATGCGGQGLGVWESTNAITWTTGVCAHSGSSDDRESMWVDNNPSSPYYGRMYISWNDFAASQGIYVVRSDDGTTWTSATVYNAATFYRNVQITVSPGPDGTVFIAGMNEGGGGGANRINLMYRSTDGGLTWANVYTGPSFTTVGSSACPYNPYFYMVAPIWRYMGWGQPAVGPASTVHYVYAGAGATGDYGDIYYIRSTDNGTTWSTPLRLNTDTTTQTQWMPSLTATASGQVLASWYDRRNTTDGQNYELWGRISNNGGASWQNDDVISDVISPQLTGSDCIAGSFDFESPNGTTGLVTWKDGRITPQMEIFFDQIQLCTNPPNFPPCLTATPTGPNQITVDWCAVPGADCYNVYRSNSACPGSTFTIVSACQTATTYVDNSVSGGSTYSYKVTAASTPSNCESAFSACADATAPGLCLNLPTFGGLASASSAGTANCQINLSWAAGSSNCPSGPGITYHIYKSTDPSFVPSPTNRIAFCITSTTYTDADVNYGTTYYYIVRAEDTTNSDSGPCNGGNIDTNLTRKSAAPAGPTTTLFSDNFEVSMANWTISSRWAWSTVRSHSATHSAWSQDNSNQACTLMTKTTLVSLPDSSGPSLSFWTAYNTESGYDGGIVQGSSNGTTFVKLNLAPNYPGTMNGSVTCNGGAQPAFSGYGNFTWAQYSADLTAFAGGGFTPRFNYATDVSVNYGGWYIDDVSITYGSACTNTSCLNPGHVLNSLRIIKSGTSLVLNWMAAGDCCTVSGYGLYRGMLPWTGYNHISIDCSITGTNVTTDQATESYYFLIVALYQNWEGSYGKDSTGTERPQGYFPCHAQCIAPCNEGGVAPSHSPHRKSSPTLHPERLMSNFIKK